MGKIFDAIDKQLIRPRVETSYEEGFSLAKEDIERFYIRGNPKVYKRTVAYGDSPNSAPPSGGNGDYHYNIRLNDPEYHTGTWYEAEEDIKKAIMENFSK